MSGDGLYLRVCAGCGAITGGGGTPKNHPDIIDARVVGERCPPLSPCRCDRRASLPEGRHDTALPEKNEGGVYIASRSKHGARWVRLRNDGFPVSSTWIDESGDGQTSDWTDLWRRCLREAANSAALVLYAEAFDMAGMKGAWAEVGAALANGVPVFFAGTVSFPPPSIMRSRLVTVCASLEDALEQARDCVRPAITESPVVPSSGASTNVSGDATPRDEEVVSAMADECTCPHPPNVSCRSWMQSKLYAVRAAEARLRSTRGGTGHG